MRFERVSARDLTRIFAMEKILRGAKRYAFALLLLLLGAKDWISKIYVTLLLVERPIDLSFSSVTLYKSRDYD